MLNDFVPNATKDRELLLVSPLRCGRVIEAPVEELVGSWKYRAPFPSVVTNRYDVRNVLSQQRDDILRLLAGNINSDLPHSFHGKGIKAFRLNARAHSLKPVPGSSPKISLCHLAP